MLTAIILCLLAIAAFLGMGPLFASHAFNRSKWKLPAYNLWTRAQLFIIDCAGGNRAAVKTLFAQLNQGVMVAVQFIGAGAAVMTNGDGDPNAIWLTNTRQGAGKYTLTTKDAWLYLTCAQANYGAATLSNFWVVNFGIPAQTATTNVWTVTVQFYSAAGGSSPTLTDPIASDVIFFLLIFRNSLLNP
jgi:hypothetical protein